MNVVWESDLRVDDNYGRHLGLVLQNAISGGESASTIK